MREWYELKFSYEFRSKFGTEFQDFFASIMERRYPADFQKVKPYGKTGDKKCDGYHQSLSRVYQVYAPEKMGVAETNAKIDDDLSGAKKNWVGLKQWVFVHNQWRGIPADVLQKLLGLNGKDGVAVLRWCEPELRDVFFEMAPPIHALILGPAPNTQSFSRVQMRDLVTVTTAIAQQPPPPPETVVEVPMGKLKANSLSEHVQRLLTIGTRRAPLIKDFFENWHDPELGDRVAQTFRERYEQLRGSGAVGDEVFLDLWHFAGGGTQPTVELEAAVLAVLAFLFDECEIFEAAPEFSQ